MEDLYGVLEAHRTNKKDKKVFGLVLQGGGMRGVYSAGATAPLIEYGFTSTFDHVIGSSAGAINAIYFLGKDKNSRRTYTNDLTNKLFVDLLRKDKKVDVDYMVEMLLKNRPINISNLLNTTTKLHIVVTDALTGKKVVLSDHNKFEEIYEEIRATAALPLLYDKKIQIGDRYFIDGAVADSVPIDVAIKLGCTDIVVVLTKQLKDFRLDHRHTRLVNHLIKRFARKQTKAVRRILPTNEKLLRINLRRIIKPHKSIRVYLLEPSDDELLLSLHSIDREKVSKLASLGVKDMDKFLHKPL